MESEFVDIKKMSMGELLKMERSAETKERKNNTNLRKNPSFKQPNNCYKFSKGAPDELPLRRSASRKVPTVLNVQRPRDPRFDDLSGNLDMSSWKKKYEFITKKREAELELLKTELHQEKSSAKKFKIKKVIQRLENQIREREKLDVQKNLKSQYRKEAMSSLETGNAPNYSELKKESLALEVKQFEQLVEDNKIQKYLEKRERSKTHVY